jgi:hypothetical protein
MVMTRRQKQPLRPLSAEEQQELERIARATSESATRVARAKGLCRKNDRVGRLNFLSPHLKWLPNPCLSGGTSCQKSSCPMYGGIVAIP